MVTKKKSELKELSKLLFYDTYINIKILSFNQVYSSNVRNKIHSTKTRSTQEQWLIGVFST